MSINTAPIQQAVCVIIIDIGQASVAVLMAILQMLSHQLSYY